MSDMFAGEYVILDCLHALDASKGIFHDVVRVNWKTTLGNGLRSK